MALSVVSTGVAAPSFLGVGLAFPFQLDSTDSKPLVVSNETLVKMSMDQIINTDIGERPFLVKNGVPFGTRIRRILFDSTQSAITIITSEIPRALSVWEPRIIVQNVNAQQVPQASGSVAIVATTFFVFRSTNRSDNLVTPFVLRSSL